jgi:glycine cleavage system H protein
MVTPDHLQYTADHEWVRADGQTVRIGITDHAQDALGDIVYVNLPAVGTPVTAGEPFGEVESTKSVSDLLAPVTGVVTGRNDDLDGSPELMNTDPYGAGWAVDVEVADDSVLDELLDADAYDEFVAGQS